MPNRKKIFDQPILITADMTDISSVTAISVTSSTTNTPTLTGGMQIPFSSSAGYYSFNKTVSTNSSGAPNIIITAAFGGINDLNQTKAGPTTNTLSLTNPTSNPVGGTITQYYYKTTCFCMPVDVTVEAIEFTVFQTQASGGTFSTAVTCFPFVALATGKTEFNTLNTYTIDGSTQTLGERPFVQGDTNGSGFCITGSNNNIGTTIPAGTNVIIVCGIVQTDKIGTTQSINNIAFTGSILLT